MAALALTPEPAADGAKTWPGAQVFRINAVSRMDGSPVTARLMSFADAGGTGSGYQVWLPLPNGNYVVKLHFAETWDGVTGPAGRVFSYNVEGREFKDVDVWVKAGGGQRAYIETIPVTIVDGRLDITFENVVDNPVINGIEIIPVP